MGCRTSRCTLPFFCFTTDASLPQDTHKSLFEGVQVFDGVLLGRKGTFASTARGVIVDGVVDTNMVIYEGSGTGELAGIRGSGSSRVTFGQTEGIPMSFEVEFQ